MRKFAFFIILLILPVSGALSYCDYDLTPSVVVEQPNSTFSFNLTYFGNGTYKAFLPNTTVTLRLSCGKEFLRIEPSALTLTFENKTKSFYLVAIPAMSTKLNVTCLNCIDFNITEYRNLEISEPTTLNFTVEQKAKAGLHEIILQFQTPLSIQNYVIKAEVLPHKKITLACPEKTTQYYNYPLLFYCVAKNDGNTDVTATLAYLDKSQNIYIEAYSEKRLQIFKELDFEDQLDLKAMNITLTYDNKTITKQVNITWKDASRPKILDLEYNTTALYGKTVDIFVYAYDDSRIEKVYATVGNETLLLSKLQDKYLLSYAFKKLGPQEINITACDASTCVSRQISINVVKIPVSYKEKIILPMIKTQKTYEIELLKVPVTVESVKVNITAPDFVNINVFPLTNFKTVRATMTAQNQSSGTIKINFTMPHYVEPQNISVEIYFVAGQQEIFLPKDLTIAGSNVTCRLEKETDPFSARICEIVYPSSVEMDFIPVPVDLAQSMQYIQEELAQVKSLNTVYLYIIAFLGILCAVFIVLWLKETEFFERIRT